MIEQKAVIGNCVNLRKQSMITESQKIPHFEQVQGRYMAKSGITDSAFIRQNDGIYAIRCKVNGIQQQAEALGRKESMEIAEKISSLSKEEKDNSQRYFGNQEKNNNTISRSI